MCNPSMWTAMLVFLLCLSLVAATPINAGYQGVNTTWMPLGCYTDSVAARTLTTQVAVRGGTGNVTNENCNDACKTAGFNFAGTEYSQECWCGQSLNNGGSAIKSGCDMTCSGDAREFCGGSNRLSLYRDTGSNDGWGDAPLPPGPAVPAGWTALGCYADNTTSRSLGYVMPVNGGLTVEKCLAACDQSGYSLSGVEYGAECYCDNTIKNSGAPAKDGNAGCNMPCSGDSGETCGGSYRLNVYSRGNATPSLPPQSSSTVPITSSIPSVPSITSPTTATVTTSLPVKPTSLPPGWTYQGCYTDNYQGHGRVMLNPQPDDQQMTIESCVQKCAAAGFPVAGAEYSYQCFCDTAIHNGAPQTLDADCSNACAGNANEKCGGPDRLSIFSNATVQVLPIPVPQKTGLPGSWSYAGCITDNAAGSRTFPWQIVSKTNNSASSCLSACGDFGYPAAGMEYGQECYCGDFSDLSTNKATFVPETDCNMPCSGNPAYICGGGNRISYYTTTPVYSWNYPSGTAAGLYQFLIGGVVVPLMTYAGINGKVSFLEKGETGVRNATGAYELDLSEINNFTAAWRPMHVRTDIFCSTGLQLPDRAGRQINIGGWSGPSTFGVRLYTPDGSPGVWGKNDWQENVASLALQAGRWYPSAMLLANGSILVVGGEAGSNAAPTPSLEVLPKVGPLVFSEWLNRTDPLNLYPFLAVLPSGGIFVAYYNEARILDEVTFNTLRTLPNMPGAVNNPGGGRTYPLEGTMMLLPQYAPYNDPLGVLICGGSTTLNAALDSCITLQPETPNAKWSIERMPSRRVMSCMTSLPDGTYLIANGAHEGQAGFGLGSNPNLNAVLYDPSKPLNARMSMMANTTVARLYHSETTLLVDGRVMISGSNPQDTRYPEEYRVEVFVPPYLLSGLPRPSLQLMNGVKDWAYGGRYWFSTNATQTSTLRVSLLGADSNTHGNTMGQRTLFPEVHCTKDGTQGSLCTVIAPPNAHVCPPGWFKMFVLDGPTPSVAQFVRIGGDPGRLGNWPNDPAFLPLPGI